MKGFFCIWQNVLVFICGIIHAKLYFRVEKYRPQTLDDLISHQDILSTSKHPCASCCYPYWRTCINLLVTLSLLSNNFEESDWALWSVSVITSWVLQVFYSWICLWFKHKVAVPSAQVKGPRWMRQLSETDGVSFFLTFSSKIYQWRPIATPASLWSSGDRKDIHHSSLCETALQRQRIWLYGLRGN